LQNKLWAQTNFGLSFCLNLKHPSLDPKLKFRTSFGPKIEIPVDVSESSETKIPDQAVDPNLTFQHSYEIATVGTTSNPRLERQTKFQAVKICYSRWTLVEMCSARETLVQIAVHVEF
jgi:hypothetical protein